MANQWFRLYSEWADDPKVQMMSEAMQRRLVMMFCSKCKGETLHETELAFQWRVTDSEVAETKAVFLAKGFIDESFHLLNWNKRQFLSDSSTDRVRKYREGKKRDETLHLEEETLLKQDETQSVTAPEQNRTDTEPEQIQKKSTSLPAVAVSVLPVDFVDRAFAFYCQVLKRNPKTYTLTKKRHDQAQRRAEERLKVHGGQVRPVGDEFKRAIENLAASDFNREGGYTDWGDHIFRSAEEFEKRLNWTKPQGGNHGKRITRNEELAIGREGYNAAVTAEGIDPSIATAALRGFEGAFRQTGGGSDGGGSSPLPLERRADDADALAHG